MEISWIYNIHPLVATFLLSILPVFELRAAIPMVMANFNTPLWQIFVVAVLSSIIPGILIVYFLGPISNYLRRWKIFDRFFDALFARTRAKYDKKYAVLSKVALMLFVAIPLPGTGVWTGSLIAWLFNFDKQQSLIYIGLGSFLAGVLVMMISLGAFKIFEIIL